MDIKNTRLYGVTEMKAKEALTTMDIKKYCLSCANSFSEQAEDKSKPDILHCMEQDGKIVDEDGYCEKYN